MARWLVANAATKDIEALRAAAICLALVRRLGGPEEVEKFCAQHERLPKEYLKLPAGDERAN